MPRDEIQVLPLEREELTDAEAGLERDDMAELLARLRAVLRRRGGTGGPLLGNHLVTLDPAARDARRPGGEPVRLSAREFALLQALRVRPGAILSRAELEERIYGWGEEVESNAVEFLIHALRRTLGAEVLHPLPLEPLPSEVRPFVAACSRSRSSMRS